MLKRPLLSAIVLTVLTFLTGLVADHLPYSKTRDVVTDAITLPGGFVASFIYPEGIHTGYGAQNWGLLVLVSNLAVYVVFWYLCLRMVRLFRRKGKDVPARTA